MVDLDFVLTELARELRARRPLPHGQAGVTAAGREVRIEHARGLTVDWIVLRTPICEDFDLDPTLVLERNARLAFAAIVLAAGVYWLRVAVPSDSVELADPTRVLALLESAATELAPRRATAANGSSQTMFDHFST